MSIPESEWKWFGNAAHFICGHWCRFHLATQVGDYLVSTVGEYVHPRHSSGQEQKESEWLLEHPLGEEIGYGRIFETMVFKAGAPCAARECGCGLPDIDGHELDGGSYNDRCSATEGHIDLCRKAAEDRIGEADDS